MIIAFLFAVSVFLGAVCTVAYKLGAQRIKNTFDLSFILFFQPLILSAIFLIPACFEGFIVNCAIIFPSMLSGVSTFAAMYSLFKSMGQGSFGVTAVLTNMSFVVPIVLSLLFLNETASIIQLCGMLSVIVAVVLVNLNTNKANSVPAKNGNGAPVNSEIGASAKVIKYPVLWALAACIFNGLINFGVKINQYFMPGEGVFTFNFFTYLFCAISALAYAVAVKIKTKEKIKTPGKIWLPLILLVVACGVNFYIQTLLPQYVNAAVQFTICIGGAMLIGVLLSHLVYKEKLNWRSIVTVLCGALAIVLEVV